MTATAEVDAAEVRRLCKNYLGARRRIIERKRELYVEKRMQDRVLFFGLYTIKGLSREEAERMWEEDRSELITPKDRAELYAWSDYQDCLKLLALANGTSAPTMQVSTECSFIF